MRDNQFYEACQTIYNNKDENTGIGTLGEKTLHAVLKYYFEPNCKYHEIRQNGYVADISYGDYTIEIQTRSFDKLRKKLDCFLELGKVRVVFPVAHEKWIQWIDEETKTITKKRKSPKRGSKYQVFYELYKIKSYLAHPNFIFTIVLVDIEEQRLLNGWSDDKKRGASRYERLPVKLVEVISLESIEDYMELLPEQLDEIFTTNDYQKATKISIKDARTALHVLCYMGVIQKCGKQGNRIVYKRGIDNTK